jgi:hypothetical protein
LEAERAGDSTNTNTNSSSSSSRRIMMQGMRRRGIRSRRWRDVSRVEVVELSFRGGYNSIAIK